MQQRREEGIPANCGEYFYTDPLLSPGQRVYNCMTPESLEVFRDFRLQTPPPIMSSCIFPSSYEDDPMSDEEEALGDPSDIGGSVDPPPLQPECSPLFASPGPSNTLELEAAGALLCLSDSAPPPCGHECTGSAHLYF
ncbi:uncharacterized protein RB166_010266 [Leptodactylus fuscus]